MGTVHLAPNSDSNAPFKKDFQVRLLEVFKGMKAHIHLEYTVKRLLAL